MKKIRLISAVLFVCILFTGCGTAGQAGKEAASVPSVSSSEVSEAPAASGEENVGTDAAEEEAAAPEEETDAPKIENISNNEEGHYTFQPHVFSTRYLEQFGEEKRDAFFAFCDALRKGEDSFACPDEDAMYWCTGGRFADFFFPVARPYIGTGTYHDGRAEILYLIPKEDFMKKEKAFEEAIAAILNDCLSDDYCELEKILALYEYMTTRYTYDFDMSEDQDALMDEGSTYRCLTEQKGVCGEIAGLYNYLLLQVGIDSDEMGGVIFYTDGSAEQHGWVFVTLNGKSYHIDPTFGLTAGITPLYYFMMTDEVREVRDSFPKEFYSLGAMGDQSREYFEFEAVSEDFSGLWDYYYLGMDREKKEIVYDRMDGTTGRFPYPSA